MSYPANRNPMGEARRQHIHGALRTNEPRDRFTIGIVGLIVAITMGAVCCSIFPAASDANPRAPAQPARDVEAVADMGHGR